MTDDDRSTDDDRPLGDLFVEMTGETVVTDSQDAETRKEILDAADEEQDHPETNPPGPSDALEDAIADPEPE